MFKNANQRKFLFALDKDKKKGLSGEPLVHHQITVKALPGMGKSNLTQPHQEINPISVPGLPGLNKLPKFGKLKNSLKGPFKFNK